MASPLPTWIPPKKNLWQQFRHGPAIFLAQRLHQWRPITPSHQRIGANAITIVCISDTHNSRPQVPDGDVLLHAGDLTRDGSFQELQAQLNWLGSLPHRYKVVIAGNHDKLLDPEFVARFPDKICEIEGESRGDLKWHDLIYLNNSSTTLTFAGPRRISIFGSPWTPQCGTFAFQYPPIRNTWTGSIPEGTDLLLTHGPPKGYLDLGGKGCPHLLREVTRTRPRAVVFGHIHSGHGQEQVEFHGAERCYQTIVAGDGGLWTVLMMMGWLLVSWLKAWMPFPVNTRVYGSRMGTTMVNAAMVEGARNERSQEAIVLEI